MSRTTLTDKKLFVTPFFNFIFGNSLHVIANPFFLEISRQTFFGKSFLDIYFCPFLKSPIYFGQTFFIVLFLRFCAKKINKKRTNFIIKTRQKQLNRSDID